MAMDIRGGLELNLLFPGDGEMARRMREHAWSRTPLDAPQAWPQSLKAAVRLMLGSRYPMFVWWGAELTNFYNDAYIDVLGARHPSALARSAPEIWHEIWDVLGPQVELVLRDGASTWNDRVLLVMQRKGYTEETYFTFSYSPAFDDDGAVGGVFCACTEDTSRVLGERRLQSLRALSSATLEARSAEAACRSGALALQGNAHDLPFALIYLQGADGMARLAASAGVAAGAPCAPASFAPQAPDAPWPLHAVSETRLAQPVADLERRFGAIHAGPWPEAIGSALVLPLVAQNAPALAGWLVCGLSPRRLLDDDCRDWLSLVAAQLAAAIADARAFEAEQRRAHELAELDRAKTAFFTNVSHEFRTPLTLMLGPLDELTRQADRSAVRELAGTAQRNATRLLKLVNTLLDFARVEGGRADASFEATDLAACTAELASTFRSACERAGLSLLVDCPRLPQAVFVDRDQWEKIVLNLLSNAFKFTLQGEIALRLRASADGSRAELTVRDTGSGIPAAELPKLFGRFQRIDNVRGRSFEGSGIGLALVQELIRLHGGTVRADSVEGRGTVFTVSLPFGSAHLPAAQLRRGDAPQRGGTHAAAFVGEALQWLPAEAGAAESGFSALDPLDPGPVAVTPSRGAPRILVADDNADLRGYLKRLLGAHYAVQTVGDGQAALDAALADPPDLVLSDMMMPRLDGFGLIGRLRSDARTRTLPVILLSARAGEEARVKGLAAGADDYLVKPFSARELLARVAAHLATARVRREAQASAHHALSNQVSDLTALHEQLTRLTANRDAQTVLDEVLRAALALTQSDKGMLCLVEAHLGGLEQVASVGLHAGYLELMQRVPKGTGACGTCYATGRRVVVEDTEVDPIMAPLRDAVRAAGYRSAHATPLLASDGSVLGVLTTYMSRPGRPSEREMRLADLLARHAASYIEQSRLLEQLRDADRRKDEFLATLAHELRNPLAPIRNSLHLLRAAGARMPPERVLEMLERQTGHLVRLVDDLMEVSRISRGAIELKRARIDLAVVVHSALETSKPLIDHGGHTLRVVLPDEPIEVDGDAVRLAQVFANLLNNAAKYTDSGGAIELVVRRDGDQAIVTVRDNGIGIATDQLPKLFRMFGQVEHSTARAQGGLGIGLALVRQLVQMHGGSVEAASEGPGCGSKFTLRLPLAASGSAAGARAVQAAAAAGARVQRVLVVDDNRDAADSLGMLLRFEGNEVRVEHDGSAALAAFGQWRPSVVLLDLGMPGIDGLEVARRMRAGAGSVALIALTGWGQQHDRERTLAAGFDHHLVKPVDPALLQTLLASLEAT